MNLKERKYDQKIIFSLIIYKKQHKMEDNKEITNETEKILPLLNFGNLPPIGDLPPIRIGENAPPIPAELIQPTPARLVIANPSVTIQTATTEQVTNLMKGVVKPIDQQTVTIVPTKSLGSKIVTNDKNLTELNQMTKNLTELNQMTKNLTDLDTMLIKRESETQDFFNMRSVYAKVALSVFQGKINPATAILLGQMAANKAVYGLTYPEESDRVIRYINEQIMANY
jgi:hypothetical protein